MKIYTKTGDAGLTGLVGGERIPKDDPRIEAYGTVDELNACLGLVRSLQPAPDVGPVLEAIQHRLFAVGAELASPDTASANAEWIAADDIESLETTIDRFDRLLPTLKNFILPTGVPAATALHQARAVCRRAERRVVRLGRETESASLSRIVVYLNRLSDLCFVLSRYINQVAGEPDQIWHKKSV